MLRSTALMSAGFPEDKRMDVYLSSKRDLLVVKKGSPIPSTAMPGSWKKSKKRVAKVSEEIRSAVEKQGYYIRKLKDRLY